MSTILFWTNAYAPMMGGAEIWSRRYLAELKARGHRLQVIAATDGAGPIASTQVDGIDILWLPLGSHLSSSDPAQLGQLIARARETIAAFAPDIIQISNFGMGALTLARLVRARFGAPVLLTAHGPWPDGTAQAGTPLDGIVRTAQAIVAFDPSIATWLDAHWPGRPVTIIPHAVPRPIAACRPPDPAAPFLFLGRHDPEKGLAQLIEAFRLVLREAPHARLIAAGDGSERSRIEAAIAGYGIGHAVALPGSIVHARVDALIDASLAVVMPSVIEGFGLVAAEAAWRARAVIAYDVGGLRSTVIHDRTGLMCPPGDVTALAEAMLALLRDPGRAAALGEAGRRAMEARPGWPAHVDGFEEVFGRLLAGPVRVAS